ncbi:hypothetical protein D3C84_1139830 [compost metagenome]
MILQILAYTWKILQDFDAVALQFCFRPHTRKHQQLRRLKGSGSKDYFPMCP